jgi:hypothetical protein
MCERKRLVTGCEGISIFGYMRGRLYQHQTTPEITYSLATRDVQTRLHRSSWSRPPSVSHHPCYWTELAAFLAYFRKCVQQSHETHVLHRAKHRVLAQFCSANSRRADSKSHSCKEARVVAFRNCFEYSSESFAIPRDLWRFLELHGLMRLAPCAVATLFFTLWQRVAKVLG